VRILFHGVAPWFPTGYGTQTAVWAKRMAQAGHEVIISAQAGSTNCSTVHWEGLPVLPSPLENQAIPSVLQTYMDQVQPDLTLFLHDVWNFGDAAIIFKGRNVAAWIPTDTHAARVPGRSGLAKGDIEFLELSGVRPIAMSKHGEGVLRAAGHDPLYVPHGIDTLNAWTPLTDEERAGIREAENIPADAFVVGVVGQNLDPRRKSWSEHMLGFARFRERHPEAILAASAMVVQKGSNDLLAMARACGLEYPAIRFTDQVMQYTGIMPQQLMRSWYGRLDVLLNCTHAEGFGLAAIEAQACGTPVINMKGHTGPELAGPGWVVDAQEFYNPTHESWWWVPSVKGITKALNEAHSVARYRRDKSRAFAEQYDIERVWPYWEKALAELAP